MDDFLKVRQTRIWYIFFDDCTTEFPLTWGRRTFYLIDNYIFITNFAAFQASFLVLCAVSKHFWCLVVFLNFICWWYECKSWKPCLVRYFFLAYSFESMRELSLRTDWLMSQGSLKQLVTSWECSCLWDLLWLDQCLKSLSSCSACIYSIGSLPFHISNSSSNFRTASLFALWLSWHFWQVYSFLSIS